MYGVSTNPTESEPPPSTTPFLVRVVKKASKYVIEIPQLSWLTQAHFARTDQTQPLAAAATMQEVKVLPPTQGESSDENITVPDLDSSCPSFGDKSAAVGSPSPNPSSLSTPPSKVLYQLPTITAIKRNLSRIPQKPVFQAATTHTTAEKRYITLNEFSDIYFGLTKGECTADVAMILSEQFSYLDQASMRQLILRIQAVLVEYFPGQAEEETVEKMNEVIANPLMELTPSDLLGQPVRVMEIALRKADAYQSLKESELFEICELQFWRNTD